MVAKTLLAAAALLGLSKVVIGADYSWTAANDLVNGSQRNCGNEPYSHYKIEVNGKRLVGTPVTTTRGSPFVLDLRSLQPDGSGRVTAVDPNKKIPFSFDFAAGAGPRKILIGSNNMECRYLLTPMEGYTTPRRDKPLD
jgi:hypothetical protein